MTRLGLQRSIKDLIVPRCRTPVAFVIFPRREVLSPSSVARSLTLSRPRFAHFQAGSSSHSLLPAPKVISLATSEETAQATKWVNEFKKRSIPRRAVELSFSRSSGPGGQNVNKVNTKVTARCPVDSPWIPPWACPALKASPFYTSSSKTILITSTAHRSQAQNIDDCLAKLHDLVISASSAPIRKEPTEAQQGRVAELQRLEKARRKREKDQRSMIKKSRASGRRGGDWD